MLRKQLIACLILGYFVIALYLALTVDAKSYSENSYVVSNTRKLSSQSRSKRQIPFISNWWTGSTTTSTSRPISDNHGRASSYYTGHGGNRRYPSKYYQTEKPSTNNYGSNKYTTYNSSSNRLPSTGKEVSDRDSRCKLI